MKSPLIVEEIQDLIQKAANSFWHEECASCEVFLGYITQLEIDADSEGRHFLRDYKPPKSQIHSSMGCDPCPPGILHTKYIREKKE